MYRTVVNELSSFFRLLNQVREHGRICALGNVNLLGGRSLTPREMAILQNLGQQSGGQAYFAELMSALDRESQSDSKRSTISQAITRLKDDGLVHRSYPDDSPRKPLIKLTKRGRSIALALHDIDTFLVPKFLASLDLDADTEGLLASVFAQGNADFAKRFAPAEPSLDPLEMANAGRVYDCWLGGQFYFPADELAARLIEQKLHSVPEIAQANRAFLRRAVRFLAEEAGVEQFIDVGSGLPTSGNTHQVARSVKPAAKVLYVDSDPYAVKVSQLLFGNDEHLGTTCCELSDTDAILTQAKRIGIEFSSPVAIVLAAVVHFVLDFDEACRAVWGLRQGLKKGGYLAISHAHEPPTGNQKERMLGLVEAYTRLVAKAQPRSDKEIREFFKGTTLVDPGPSRDNEQTHDLVFAPDWRPDPDDPYLPETGPPLQDHPEESFLLVGVGRVTPP